MAELTLDVVNKELERQGLPKIDKLATATAEAGTTTTSTDDKGNEPPAGTTTTKPAAATPAELTDEQILAFLDKKGIKATSIEDLKPKETITAKTAEQLQEEKESAKLRFALEKGLFTTKEHEGFITDSKNKETLVFADYVTEQRADDPTLSDEDLENEYREKFGLNEDKDSRKYKRGQKEIDMLADKILKNRYGKIYDAESAYSNYESQQKTEKEESDLLKEKTPLFVKDITEIFDGLKKIPVKFSDSESYEATAVADSITNTLNHFLKPSVVKEYVTKGWTKDEMKEIAFTAILRQNYTKIIEEVSDQKLLKNQAGTRGIVPGGTPAKTTGVNPNIKNLTENQKKEYYRYHPEEMVAN